MKRSQKQWRWLLVMAMAMVMAMLIRADNPCVDSTVYGSWNCQGSASLTSGAVFDQTNIVVAPDAGVAAPVLLTAPVFSSGQEQQLIGHTCSGLIITNLSPVLYVPGAPYFVPPLFSSTNVPGTYAFTAEVNGQASSLAGWWPGEGNATDIVFGNNGTVNGGLTYDFGMVGRSFNFNGVDSYIEVGSGPPANLDGAFSAEAWINFNGVPDVNGINIFSKGDDTAYFLVNWGLDINPSRQLTIYAGSPSQYWQIYTVHGTNALVPGTWYHVAITYDGTTERAYLNGNQECAMRFGTIDQTAHPFRIGALKPNDAGRVGKRFFSGLIDEASFYSCALGALDVQAIYNAGSYGKNWGGQTNGAALPTSCVCSSLTGIPVGTISVTVTSLPPVITSQPTNQTVVAGGSGSFQVSASGALPLGYQWQFNGANIAGATASIFTTNNVTTNSAGYYSVAVTNNGGSVTSLPALLAVLQPVSLVGPIPASETVVQGGNANFSVTAGGTQPQSFQWYFNSTNLNTTNAISYAVAANYTGLAVTPSSAGNYFVAVTNSAGGVVSSNGVLNIIVPPIITNQPVDLTVNLTSNAVFSVGVYSNSYTPALSYQWYWDGAVLPLMTNRTLTLSNVQMTNVGYYSVVISNQAGTNTSLPAYLTVALLAPGLTNTTAIQLNGNASYQSGQDGRVLELTTNLNSQAGSAFFLNPISLVSNASFSTFFSFRLSNSGGAANSQNGTVNADTNNGADGIVFVAQTVANNVGGLGGGMGYYGITNSVGVEFDTWFNSTNSGNGPTLDPFLPVGVTNKNGTTGDGNHVGVDYNGFITNTFTPFFTNGYWAAYRHVTNDMNDGNLWYAWVDYDGTNLMLSISETNSIRPATAYLTNQVNLLTYLGTNKAFIGFTAGTGGDYNRQDIVSWQFVSPYHPIGVTNNPPTVTVTAPMNNVVYPYGPPIGLLAVAAELNGAITNVIFQNYGTNLGTTVVGANNSFALAWTNALQGSNSITAVAWDYRGMAVTSSPAVIVMADQAPVPAVSTNLVLIWTEGNTNASTNVTFTVTDDGYPRGGLTNTWNVISGSGATVFSTTNYVTNATPGAALAYVTNTTVTFSTNGAYLFSLTANDGAFTTTQICQARVLRRPFVSITVPANNTIVSGTSAMLVTASAYDLSGVVTNVQFYDGTNLIGTVPGESANYSIAWTNLLSGTNTLAAVATDSNGVTNRSTNVMVYVNAAPVVNAGANQIITLPLTNAALAGTISDDGMPPGAAVAVAWSVVSSNGPVTIVTPTATNSAVYFATNGVYVFKLTANDTAATNGSTVTVTVNQHPQCSAGTNFIVNLTGSSVKVNLNGSFTDDGLPVGAPVGTVWSVVSATNGSVVISNINLAATTATFTNNGNYTLQLTVNDTVSTNTATVSVIVNRVPVANAGTGQTLVWAEGYAALTNGLTGTVTDDGYPSNILTAVWSEASGPGTVNFRPNANVTNASAVFSTNGVYVLKLTASDGFATNVSSCTVTILRRPFVGMLAPTNNATFNTGVVITNLAFAYDLDGTVTNLQFYDVNGGVTNQLTAAVVQNGTNYSQAWSNAPAGSNSVYAVAVDNSGLTNISSAVNFLVLNTSETVAITSPINQIFLEHSNIVVTAVATSTIPGVVVSRVQFYWGANTAGTNLLGVAYVPTNNLWSVKWQPYYPGTDVLTAVAVDSRGTNITSVPVTNIVRMLPSVTWLTPTNGSIYLLSPTNVILQAAVTVDPSTVATNVIFYQGTNVLGVRTNGVAGVYSWTNSFTSGVYLLRAQARDGNGGIAYSTNVVITVETNQPPFVYAGTDQTNNLSTNAVTLNGQVADDGLPYGILQVAWTNLSGPAPVRFTLTNQPVTSVFFTATGVYQFVLSATDKQYTNYSTNTVTILTSNLPPIVDAGSNQVLILPALANTNPLQTIKLYGIGTSAFSGPKGLDYYQPSNCVIISSGDTTNYSLVLSNGDLVPFIEVDSANGDEAYISTVRNTMGGFKIGEMFSVNGANAGEILRIEPDGTLMGTNGVNHNAWVVLSNAADGYVEGSDLRGGVWVDRTGVWGGNLVVASSGGNIWVVNKDGQSTLLARNLSQAPFNGDHFEGITTVPNDVQRYGPWAGKILVGGDNDTSPIIAIDTNGFAVPYQLGIGPEDIRVIPDNENFFGIGDGVTSLTGAPAWEFQGMAGDILVASEFSGLLHRVHWDGQEFETYTIGQGGSWEQVNFAPAGIGDIAPVDYVPMHGAVWDDGRLQPISNYWAQVSGPGPVTFDEPTFTNSLARFTVPGTYYLRLTAYDGQFYSYDQTRVDVIRNQAPVVSAGTNQVINTTNLVLNGSVSDDGWPFYVTNMTWLVVATPPNDTVIISNTNLPVTMAQVVNTNGNSPNGTYVLMLEADDGQATNYAEVTYVVGLTNITLTPGYGWAQLTNMPYTVTANVVDPNDQPVAGVQVDFAVTVGGNNDPASGATIVLYTNVTDAHGNVSMTYTRTNVGEDNITATIDGTSTAAGAFMNWAQPLVCGLYSNSVPYVTSPSFPTNENHFANFYTTFLTAGTSLQLNFSNVYNTVLILRDPNEQVVNVNLNGTLNYTPTLTGNYLLEMVDTAAGSDVPRYWLAPACSTVYVGSPGFSLADSDNPFGLTNFATVDMESSGGAVDEWFYLSNPGSAPLVVSNITVTGDFSVTPTSAVVPPGGSTSFDLTFNASALGTTNGILQFVHNAPGNTNTYYLQGTLAEATIEVQTNVAGGSPKDLKDGGTLFFQPVLVGQQTNELVTILNNGSSDLILSNFALATPTGVFTNLTDTNFDIPAGGSTNINLSFYATSNAFFGGEFQFHDNAPAGVYTFYLAGTVGSSGVPPTANISASPSECMHGPATVTLYPSASSSSTGIASIQVYAVTAGGTIFITNLNNPDTTQTSFNPSGINWSNVAVGVYQVFAVGRDISGLASSYSTSVIVYSNRPPVTYDYQVTVNADTTNDIIDPISFFQNEWGLQLDPDGDTVLVVSNSTPVYGTAGLVNGGAQLSYTPPSGMYGSDEFSYTVADGYGGYATANIFVTVLNPLSFVGQSQMAAACNGTNISDGGSLVFPTTVSNAPTTLTLALTNTGTVDLIISNITITGDFTNLSGADYFDLPAGAGTNLLLGFNASSNEVTVGQLLMPNNSADQNFVLNLLGYAFPPGALPVVTMVSPVNGGTFYAPALINLAAVATSSATNISYVDFQQVTTNGILDWGWGNPSGSTYGLSLANQPNGSYTFRAVAVDAIGRQTTSSNITVQVLPATGNTPPVAVDDRFTVNANSYNNLLNVLGNDIDTNGTRLTVIAVTQPGNGGTVTIANGGGGVLYTPAHGFSSTDPGTGTVYQGDAFTYEISDGQGGTAWAYVSIGVFATPPPQLQIVSPPDGFSTNAGAVVPIIAQMLTPWQFVTNVEFYQGSVFLGSVTNGPGGYFTNYWTASAKDCSCGFYATAYDAFGQVGTSQEIHISVTPPINGPGGTSIGPVAAFATYAAGTNAAQPFTNLVTIRDGMINLSGQAYHPLGSNVVWQLGVYTQDGQTLLRDLTPQSLTNGYHFSTVGSSSGAGMLVSNCDFTTLQNGVYLLRLSVVGGYMMTNVDEQFILESNLKIGQFSFSQQDLVIPVNGIPLTVTRTYDSLNPNQGDFGYSWTYSLSDMDVQLDEARQDVTIDGNTVNFGEDDMGDEPAQTLSVRSPGGGRDVTLTLPDGRRTTFYFSLVSGGGDAEGSLMNAVWTPEPGVTATLATPHPAAGSGDIGDNTLVSLPSADYPPYWAAAGEGSTMDNYDFPGWVLTTADGTKYNITRGAAQNITYEDPENPGLFLNATVYGAPVLTSIVERSGDTIQVSPNAITHIDPLNHITSQVTFTRNANNLISSVSDPVAQSSSGYPAVKYEYDGFNNLMYVEQLLDRNAGTYITNTFLYQNPNFPHYITQIIDPRGNGIARNLYDDSGKLIAIVDADGHTNSFVHDVVGRTETQYDRSGQPTVYTYDSRGDVIATQDALGHVSSFAYDSNGYLTNSVDPLTNVTSYANDPNGHVLSIILPHPAGTDPEAYTTSYTWDSNGNQTSVVLPSGGIMTNVYDTYGNLTSMRDESGNLISSATYDAVNLPASQSDRFGTYYYAHDSIGNLTAMTNELGTVVTSGYDANGNMTTVADVHGSSTMIYDGQNRQQAADYGNGMTISNGFQTYSDWASLDAPTIGHMQRQFDNQGRLNGWVTANGATPGFAYDADGRVQYQTNLIGGVTYSVYNAVGWLVARTNLATGAGVTYGYDAAGQKTSETNAYGQVMQFAYWPSGSLMAMTNANGTYIHSSDTAGACSACGNSGTVTDALGRLEIRVDSAHDLPLQTIRLAYAGATGVFAATNSITYLAGMTTPEQEAADYPSAITDEGGRTRQFGYTATGQLYRSTDLSGNVWWTNQFDGNGVLTNLISPTGESIGYTYDQLQNPAAVRFSDGNWLTNFYDAQNRLSGTRFPSGVAATNFYDFAGRLTNRTSSIGETASFTYNLNDAITTMIDNTGTTVNHYDTAGRLSGIDYPNGASIRYQLDLLDRITAITNRASLSAKSYVTYYQYDGVGNITNVIDPFKGQTSYVYDQVGRRTQRTLPNGIVTIWQYNWKDQVTNIVHKIGSTVLASATYVRAADGEPARITREDGTYVLLSYDASLRLTNEVYYNSSNVPQTTNGYAYDADGNRISLNKGGTMLTNSISSGYQITSIKNGGTTTESYGYDTGGRVTSMTRDSQTWHFGYNSADQLTAVTNTTSSTWVTYVHDAEGRRTVSTNSSGVVRKFLVAPVPGTDLEGPQLIADGTGATQAGYVYVGSQPVLNYTDSGTAVYYLEDGMGSIIGLAPANSPNTGNTTRLFYDGFGNGRATNGPAPSIPAGAGGDFRFQGAWLEASSGLYNMRAREYDARLGRFTSRDSLMGDLRMPELLHPYNYAAANAYVYQDLNGHEFTLVSFNAAEFIDSTLNSMVDAAIAKAKQELQSKLFDALSNVFINQLSNLFPSLGSFWKVLKSKDVSGAGNEFANILKKKICRSIGADNQFASLFYFEPAVDKDGNCDWDGLNCPDLSVPGHFKDRFYPDYLISEYKPKDVCSKNPPGKSVIIGDVKITGNSLYNQYVAGNHIDQFYAIVNYAGKHTYTRSSLFMCVWSGERSKLKQVQSLLGRDGLEKGVVVIVFSVLKNKNF